MLDPNISRTARQELISEEWLNTGGKGTLEACTRFGKTHVMFIIIKKVLDRNSSRKIIIVVPSIPLQEQLSTKVEEKGWSTNVKVKVINTAAMEEDECDLLIIDEIHRSPAEFFSQLFVKIKYKWIFGCTATLKREDGKHVILDEIAPVFHTVTLREALSKGWVSEFDIYNLGLELREREAEEYKRLHDIHNTSFAVFGWDFKLAFSCMGHRKDYNLSNMRNYQPRHRSGVLTDSEGVPYFKINTPLIVADSLGNGWDEQRVMATAFAWRNAMQERNDLVYNADVKLQTTLEIIQRTDESIITFSKSTAFADKITELASKPAIAYHSKIPKKQRSINLSKFIDKEYHSMHTVDALNEGKDFPGVNVAVIEATTQVGRTAIQRVGRVLMQGGRSKIIWLYIKGSVEFGRVNKCQTGIPNKRWVDSLDQIF